MTYNYGGLKVTLRLSNTIYVSLVNITTERATLNKHPSRRRSNVVTLIQRRDVDPTS